MKFPFGKSKSEQINPIALIQLSGGIDSTYCLYRWLIENPNEYILVHHINLINHEKRANVEKKSVHNILEWLNQKGLNNFIYLENTFDYGNLGFIIKDVEVCGFHIGIILRNKRWSSVKDVILAIYEPEIAQRQKRAANLIKSVSLRKQINLHYPIKGESKSNVIKGLPIDLYNLCWYCRTPKNDAPCNNCKTCIEVKESV